MTIERLTPQLIGNLVSGSKDTTTSSVTRGDICKLSSGEWVAIGTVTDGTSTNVLGIAENRSPAASSRTVECLITDGLTEYECQLNTATTITFGNTLKLTSSAPQKLTLVATTTDRAVAWAVEGDGATAVSTIKARFIAASITR